MRIAHIITTLVRGGAEENTLLSCNAQADAGHDVHLLIGTDASPAMLDRIAPGVTLHRIWDMVRPVRPLSDSKALMSIARVLRETRPDLVHTHTSKAGILGRFGAKLAGVPAIIHGVHILPFLNVGAVERVVYLTVEHAAALVTDAFVNVSGGMRDACLAHHIGRPEDHVVIPSGMDIEQFRSATPFSPEELAENLGISPSAAAEAKLVVMVAALEPRKRIPEFLEVFAEVVAREPKAMLVLLGESHDRDRIVEKIGALGLSRHVSLVGFRTDVERWLACADVCVLASEREGLPRAVVQYALAARPVVVTALPGIEAVVDDGRSGFLVPPDKLGAMLEPLTRILADPALRESLSARAREFDLSPWSTDFMVAELERVYSSVVARRKGGRPQSAQLSL